MPKKLSSFLYLKWWVAQQDFSKLLTNESVRALAPLRNVPINWRMEIIGIVAGLFDKQHNITPSTLI